MMVNIIIIIYCYYYYLLNTHRVQIYNEHIKQ